MTKSGLGARPVFHHRRDAIEVHVTVVFAALAVARHLQHAIGTSIKKIVQALRTARSATIEINGERLTPDPAPDLTGTTRAIRNPLETGHQSRWRESGESRATRSLQSTWRAAAD